MAITIGADPEFFLRQHGVPVSAYDLVPGTKQKPHPVPFGAIQHDGTAAEFNIDPVETKEEFIHHINAVTEIITTLVGAEVHPTPTVDWGEKIFTFPEEAFVMGCEPDIDAYSGCENPAPNVEATFRTAGGHIHIGGVSDTSHSEMMRLIRLMDRYVGVYSLAWDSDDRRRELYGKAGACRFKDYGVEYRTLSNAWLMEDRLKEFVFDGTMRAIAAWERGEDGMIEARIAINESNREMLKAHFDDDYLAILED